MSESTLYNKYRPISFDDVAQPHVVRVFKAQIAKAKTVSTYLLSGPSGTGKTTLARIVAMALMCKNRADGSFDPCGVCPTCVRVKKGHSRDVIEIDCAQNGKVEDIRELVSNRMRMAPEEDWVLVIMDEAHMLTVQAQNALLKAMEEPPSFVKFFVCSSEPHKIIPAIRTRCQKHSLTRVSDASIKNILQEVVEKESIEAEESALDQIVQESQGSAREALVILELVSVIDVTEDNVREVLLRGPKALSYDLLDAIARADRGEAYRLLDAAQKEGRDMTALLEECGRTLMMITRFMVDKTQDASKADDRLKGVAKSGFNKIAQILAATQILIETTTKIRQNVPADLAVQVGILNTIEQVAKIRAAASEVKA